METIITIRKNKPAYKALIALARELRKNDQSSISITEALPVEKDFDIIKPAKNQDNPFVLFAQLSDFPTIEEIRKQAWPKI
jgi:hypothetical protein